MHQPAVNQLIKLFINLTSKEPRVITPLPRSGSDREYFRLSSDGLSIIGAYNPDIKENRAFIHLTRHFFGLGLPVPELLAVSSDETCYLLTDLGSTSLFEVIQSTHWDTPAAEHTINLLKDTLTILAKLQVEGAKNLDFTVCHPKSEFDLQSVMWDLNYFKYCFLKLTAIPLDEEALDLDFHKLAQLLTSAPCSFFQYRDFQSRNIMLVNGSPYLIDYQGGRRGPCLYDVASFLYQARANLPHELRENLLEHYLESLNQLTAIDRGKLRTQFPTFALFRTLQVLGAYGFRGLYERRSHFLESIPFAVANLELLLNQCSIELPSIARVMDELKKKYPLPAQQHQPYDGLTVTITSFSYRKGYPLEHSVHGGGFVFDCRGLPNPGRLDEYKHLTGLDAPVAKYLSSNPEAQQFVTETQELVLRTINSYLSRGFTQLSVAYGCTGGQHRSVYSANALAHRLKGMDSVRVRVVHRELVS